MKPLRVQVGSYVYALVTFCIVVWLTRRSGSRVALGSGFVAACAAPMLFELPFDLIVAARTVPPIPPRPELFRDALTTLIENTYARGHSSELDLPAWMLNAQPLGPNVPRVRLLSPLLRYKPSGSRQEPPCPRCRG